MFETREELEKEIARVEAILGRPGFKYPHIGSIRLQALKRQRLFFTHPKVWKTRSWLASKLIAISEWVSP